MHKTILVVNNKGISVIIPNYNGAGLLPLILPPMYVALQNCSLPYEVIISDDCSIDDGVQFIKNNYKDIFVIENKINQGFSKTINRGIFKAKYDYVLMLNSDVKLTENYFETLLPYFDMPDTFGVMGRIIGWDNEEIQDGGKYPSFHGLKIKTSRNYIPLEPKEGDKLFSMYLSGANALVCREKLLALNGFDEIFSPFYIEDFELSLRAWRMGYKCYYEHKAVCRHKTSTTIKTKSSKSYIKTIYNRNKMILHAIHLPNNKLWLWKLQLFGELIIQTLLCKFWFVDSIKSYWKMQKLFHKKRSELNRKLILNTPEIINVILKDLENRKLQIF